MDYQYKIIVSNRTVYKEFEIAARGRECETWNNLIL